MKARCVFFTSCVHGVQASPGVLAFLQATSCLVSAGSTAADPAKALACLHSVSSYLIEKSSSSESTMRCLPFCSKIESRRSRACSRSLDFLA